MRAIERFVREAATVDAEAKTVTYHDGWDDARVAATVPDDVWSDYVGSRVAAVTAFRNKWIGALSDASRRAPPRDPRVDALTAWARAISTTLGVNPPWER